MSVTTRKAARIVAIDAAGRVLLLQHRGDDGPFWATPGGALEAGETFEGAAAREAREELGVALDADSLELAWIGRARFSLAGKVVEQEERFFRIRLESVELTPSVRETHRREGILQVRWWELAALRDTREQVFPDDLVARVMRL